MSHTARIFTQEQLTEALASACVQHEMHICTRRAGFDIAGLNLRTVAKTDGRIDAMSCQLIDTHTGGVK